MGNAILFNLLSCLSLLIQANIMGKNNKPIIVIVLSQFTALDWSAGDERELLMHANVDGRGFLRHPPLYFYTLYISVYMWESKKKKKKEPLAQGHTTRDMLNMHLDMLSASMLARAHAHTPCAHALKMAFVGARLRCPVIFYSGQLYMSIFSLKSLCLDELLSTNGI